MFQVLLSAIRFDLLQLFAHQSMPLFGLSVFLLNSSTVLCSVNCDNSVHSMTIWSMLEFCIV